MPSMNIGLGVVTGMGATMIGDCQQRIRYCYQLALVDPLIGNRCTPKLSRKTNDYLPRRDWQLLQRLPDVLYRDFVLRYLGWFEAASLISLPLVNVHLHLSNIRRRQ